jgi:CheY-like chemotaxis protein
MEAYSRIINYFFLHHGQNLTISLLLEKELEMFKCVLIVDDDVGVQDLMREYFINFGLSKHHIFTASNPMDALDIYNIKKEFISLVVCDHYMPIANGPEICDIIKKNNPNIPIVLHTGDLNITIEPLKSVDYILYKPCTIVEALNLIKKIEFNEASLQKVSELKVVTEQFQIGHVTDKFGKTYLGTVYSQSKGGCALSFEVPINFHDEDIIEISLGKFGNCISEYVVLFKSKAKIVWTENMNSENLKTGFQYL